MIDKTLMMQSIKSNLPLFLILTAVQAFFIGAMAIGGVTVAMTGMTYYSMLPGLITAVYVIVTANKLIAAQVDKGTMAYILSTPAKRSKVAATQAAFFSGSLLLMVSASAVTHIITHNIGLGSITGSDIQTILLINLGLFVLDLALSGICYLASCVFNLSKNVIAVGGGLIGAFHLFSIMPMFGESFHWMRNFTLVTLFDISSVLAKSSDFILKFLILAAIGILTYIIGSAAFAKRDLRL